MGPGCADYPPPGAATPRAAIPALFLGGDARAGGRAACLALFAYALSDAAGPTGGGGASALASLGARFGLAAPALAQWRLAQLLDEAGAGAGAGAAAAAAALEAAVAVAPAAAAPVVPWRLGAALSALGRPDAGLALLRARGCGAAACLAEAAAGLDARLACGLLAEAYTEARAFWEQLATRKKARGEGGSGADAVDADAAASALMIRLATAAAASGDLAAVCMLPLAPAEEAALAGWLGAGGGGSPDGPLAQVLFYLQRGRVPEAAVAAAAGGGLPTTPAGRAALDLLRAAAQGLPPAQRAALVGGGGAGAGATVTGSVVVVPAGGAPPPGARPLIPAGLLDERPGGARLVVTGATATAAAPFTTSTGWVTSQGRPEGGGGGRHDGGGEDATPAPVPAAAVLTLPPVLVGGAPAPAAPAWRADKGAGGGEAGFLKPEVGGGGGGRGKRVRRG